MLQVHGPMLAQEPLPFAQPAGDRQDQRHGEVGRGVGQHPGSVGDDHAALRRRADVDVVVADGHVGHDPELGPGRVEEGAVDTVVQHRHGRVGPRD